MAKDNDSDKIKLLELLLKLETDVGFLKSFAEGDEESRGKLVDEVGFSGGREGGIGQALIKMDSAKLQEFVNPTIITIKGWVKAPPWP